MKVTWVIIRFAYPGHFFCMERGGYEITRYTSNASQWQLRAELERYANPQIGLPEDILEVYRDLWQDYMYWPIFFRWSWRDHYHGGFDSARDRIYFWAAFLKRRGLVPRQVAHILVYHWSKYRDGLRSKDWITDVIFKVRPTPSGWFENLDKCVVAQGALATIPQRTDLAWLRWRMMPTSFPNPDEQGLPTGIPAPDLGL